MIAVSSTGTSPVLARLLTARIDAFIPQSYRNLAALAQRYRERIIRQITDRHSRRRFWEHLLSGRIGESILQGNCHNIDSEIDRALQVHTSANSQGEVYLVGAGPGDPDLLSFRALRLMQQCDVVLYDRLVSEQIMALVNTNAERIYVGKRRSEHAVPQESINQQLARLAAKGHRVLRLKGGDPFMFGRGGEEIETLAAEGVAFQVVPGITAAGGCASYAGIPLTHRDHAQACIFVTGHLKDGSVNLDWQALARTQQTLVIYMGLVGLPVICKELINHGLPENHPMALVAQGTRVDQQVITGTLGTMADTVASTDIKPPTLIIIGTVVSLRDKLSWFEHRR
jgi:uroporphyrin-III C-methyltransferase/precorrin-2 dehydrogenase/sirohydrochlorin ferrochelatase